MRAILLFSHGSTLCGAGENLSRLAARLRAGGAAPIVEPGYLNYSEPLFAEAFAKCVAQGATSVTIAPYFLVAGYFVKESLPPHIAAAQERFPEIKIRVAEALRFHPLLADAVEACAARAQAPDYWRGHWDTAPRFCRDNPECPLYATERCPHGHPATPLIPEAAPPAEPLEPGVGTALLVMVHGSPRPASNATMFQVVDVIKERGRFPIVEVGFMECNEPTIPEAIATCVRRGAQRVIAVPFFLHAGTHVADDLPSLLEDAALTYDGVEFRLGDYVGADGLMDEILVDRVREAEVTAD